MSSQVKRSQLRGKTGCLECISHLEHASCKSLTKTGRSRRKKCDEKRPTCSRCTSSNRPCKYPTSQQMVDRRHSVHPSSRYASTSPEPIPANSTSLSLWSESTAHRKLDSDLEVVVSRHFIETYYRFLLLPNCHPTFYDGWFREIQDLMVDRKFLRFSVLANAASHMHNTDSNPGMQSLALKYYSISIKELAGALEVASDSFLAGEDSCLMAIMFLYLHGCMGRGTYSDIPPHVKAAIRVLMLRFTDSVFTIERPFDCLALESVMYQMFLIGTGLWSDDNVSIEFDLAFWQRAEVLLASPLFPDGSTSVNSPVLGVPVALLRLAVQAKQILQNPAVHGHMLQQVRCEMDDWEALVLAEFPLDQTSGRPTSNQHEVYYESTSYLYVLVISMMLEQINESGPVFCGSLVPHQVPRSSWQVQKALRILGQHEDDVQWKCCYMGNWCVYTLGFFLDDPCDIQIIRKDLGERWELTKFMQTARFLEDLEATWAARRTFSLEMEVVQD